MPKWEHLHAERGLYDLHVLNELPASWVVARVWRNDAPHTAVFTVVVRPAISVPPRWNEEMLPVGMQFGRACREMPILGNPFIKSRPIFCHRPRTGRCDSPAVRLRFVYDQQCASKPPSLGPRRLSGEELCSDQSFMRRTISRSRTILWKDSMIRQASSFDTA